MPAQGHHQRQHSTGVPNQALGVRGGGGASPRDRALEPGRTHVAVQQLPALRGVHALARAQRQVLQQQLLRAGRGRARSTMHTPAPSQPGRRDPQAHCVA